MLSFRTQPGTYPTKSNGVDTRSAMIIVAHAMAFLLFFVNPIAGVAALMAVVVFTVGLRNPTSVAVAFLGMLWVNDVIADFHPFTQVTVWKDVLLLILVLGWLFRSAVYRLPLVRRSAISIPLTIFVVLCLIMTMKSESVIGAILGMKAVVFYLSWFYVLPSIVKTREDARNLVAAIIFGTVCISLYNLWRVQQPMGTFPPTRTGGVFPGILQTHFSSSGLLIPAGLFFMVTLAPLLRGWKKIVFWFCILVVVAGFLATTLRSGWGTTVAGLLVIGWLGKKMPQVVAALLVAVVAAGILQATLQVDVSDRAISAFDTQDVSRSERQSETLDQMIPFVLQNPFGLGTGSMAAVTSFKVWGGGKVPFAIQGGLIHNNLLMVAIETGWLGAIVFTWFLVNAFILSVRNYHQAVDPLIKAMSLALCGFVTFYICMQVLGPVLIMPSISMIAFAVFAFLVILPDLDQPETEGKGSSSATPALVEHA